MSWGPNSFSLGRAAVALLAAGAAVSAAANVLVVRSAGPSVGAYPAGRSLPDNARIALQPGDLVTVLGAGGTRTFRGPGTFSPGATVRAGTQTLAANDGRRARIGAVRTGGIVPRGPTIWHVDVSQGGTFCLLPDEANVMLWRSDGTARGQVTITPPGGRPTTLQWPAGETILAWSPGGPLSGGTYTFTQPGVAVPTRITFRTLAAEPTDLESVAAALIANGCQDQLDVLVDSQADPSPGSGS
ncbi:MAG: hypothetical protein E6G92_07075 [Alphaproteobacteria bacterium]|nr:MAG: hypothetical protein E6G92_07075 [Alphaproteobacteria bacterium]